MTKRIRCIRLFSAAIALILLCTPLVSAAENSQYSQDILSIAQKIIDWKKLDNGSTVDGYLINNTFLEQAGSTAGDWFPIGLGRLGVEDDYEGYLAVIKDVVQERYKNSEKLSSSKSTEWHRISLAVLAMGGDPTDIGTDQNGQPINLIADGTYDRGKTTSLGRQGINGWIWGLIALDSMRYEVPKDAFNTRDDIILEILQQQLTDGGFALSGKEADPDITAMAIQALAPYYNSEKVYTYTQKKTKTEVSKTVRQVVDESLTCLSRLQLETGDFNSWNVPNVESTCQVTVALCSLDIDPLTDKRFIKNGKTLLDGILQYQMDDGGFVHSFTYDPENPTSLPDESNTMASEQTLYTMAALWRQQNGMRDLYDFRPEQSEALKQRITKLEQNIAKITEKTSSLDLELWLTDYYSLPENERDYVHNYWTLSDAAKAAGVDVEAVAASTEVVESPEDGNGNEETLNFTEADRRTVDSLPSPLTTEQYVTVTKLLDKLENSEDFDGKETYRQKLTAAKEEIAAIQAEIDAINAEVLEKLYPFESISLGDKAVVDDIVARYNALSEYDQAKIDRWEDVVKTKTKIDNLLRGIVIAVVLVVVAAGVTVFVVLHIRKRRRSKKLAMEELAAQYADEDDES